jgi:hypothetical protein
MRILEAPKTSQATVSLTPENRTSCTLKHEIFFIYLLVDRRIRIRTNKLPIRMRILEAPKTSQATVSLTPENRTSCTLKHEISKKIYFCGLLLPSWIRNWFRILNPD